MGHTNLRLTLWITQFAEDTMVLIINQTISFSTNKIKKVLMPVLVSNA